MAPTTEVVEAHDTANVSFALESKISGVEAAVPMEESVAMQASEWSIVHLTERAVQKGEKCNSKTRSEHAIPSKTLVVAHNLCW